VTWQTGAGGQGLSVFYTQSSDDVTTNLATFFNAIKAIFPAAVSWSIPNTGDLIDSATGTLTGIWVGGTAASITSSGSGTYAAGTGMFVKWGTGVIRAGRKFQGRTFLCPVLAAVYDNDGTITGTNLTLVGNAATTLAAVGKLRLWGRPSAPGAADGIQSVVSVSSVPDKVTSLKTRRT